MGRRVNRREMIRSVAVLGAGSAATVLVTGDHPAAASDEERIAADGGTYSIDEVVAVQVAVGSVGLRSGLAGVTATGFPSGWELIDGDLIVVDHRGSAAFPYVTAAGTKWFSINRDPSRARFIAERS